MGVRWNLEVEARRNLTYSTAGDTNTNVMRNTTACAVYELYVLKHGSLGVGER